MNLKKAVAGAVLALAASAAVVTVAGAPAAASVSISIPGVSEFDLLWYCAESNGEFFPGAAEYECLFPDGSMIVCRRGGNCFIHFAGIMPERPETSPSPTDQRPGAGGPPVITW
jgi:hypothetical protein